MKKPQGVATLSPADLLMVSGNPALFRSIHAMAKTSLVAARNSAEVRDKVMGMVFAYRAESRARFGNEDCFEARMLGELLRHESEREHRPATVEDPLERLRRLNHLSSDELDAALLVKRVWASFSKVLGSRGSNWSGSGRGKGSVMHPGDLMGAALSLLYLDCYKPWFTKLVAKPPKLIGRSVVRPVNVVMSVIVDQRSLRSVAKVHHVTQAQIIDVLSDEMKSLSSRMAATTSTQAYDEAMDQPGAFGPEDLELVDLVTGAPA